MNGKRTFAERGNRIQHFFVIGKKRLQALEYAGSVKACALFGNVGAHGRMDFFYCGNKRLCIASRAAAVYAIHKQIGHACDGGYDNAYAVFFCAVDNNIRGIKYTCGAAHRGTAEF